MDDVLMALASKYGPAGLLAVILLKMVYSAVRAKFFPAAPADPAIPADPTAPSPHPVLDAALKAMFGKKAPAAADAHPGLLARIKGEIDALSAAGKVPAAAPK